MHVIGNTLNSISSAKTEQRSTDVVFYNKQHQLFVLLYYTKHKQ